MCPEGYPLAKYKGQRCRVLCRGGKNSILVEFRDGHRAVVSRYGVKKTR